MKIEIFKFKNKKGELSKQQSIKKERQDLFQNYKIDQKDKILESLPKT